MQVGLFGADTPRHDPERHRGADPTGSPGRFDGRAGRLFVQHDGPPGDVFEPGRDGWRLLPALEQLPTDPVVHKRACDAFYETDLAQVLDRHGATRLMMTGCATDFCVDTTIRAAASRDYDVTVVEDGHTTADRPHVDALSVIRHHNWVWQNLIHPKVQVKVEPAANLVAGMERES